MVRSARNLPPRSTARWAASLCRIGFSRWHARSEPPVTILTFLDECEDREGSRSFALTALLVPAEQYQAIRTAFYERLNWLIVPNPGQVRLAPPELHGVALLPEESDERKLEACRAVADLVTLHGLAVFRVGYRLDSPGA